MKCKGYIRKITSEELCNKQARKWYLPTFIVRNPNKPDKIRLVWDAAARYKGISLNSCLEKGPDLLNSLTTVLYNFRIGKIGICGDIAEMFHRVAVHEEDQLSQLFLWPNNVSQEPDVYAMCVRTFGASCSPALAQFVKNQNALRFQSSHPRASKSIIERHYMDDMLDSTETVEEAVTLATQVREIHKNGNFHIRNWLSNSKEVLETLNESGDPKMFCTAGKKVEQIIEPTKVLGMWWNTEDDVFTFSLKFTKATHEVLNGEVLPTKRQMLRLIMSIFDPLGILNSHLITVKLLMQNVWRSGITWDEAIPQEFAGIWFKWLSLLKDVPNIKVPRCYLNKWSHNECQIQLHIFVDASERAYAAVAYFRIQRGHDVSVSFIASKSKVAPLKPISIPRMELMAAVLGVKLGESIMKHHELKIETEIYWSDSKTVISWVGSDPMKYKQFVMFRIGEIQEATRADQWRYVPSKLNVADMATKSNVNYNISATSEWFTGPLYLKEPVTAWPTTIKAKNEEEIELKNDKCLNLVAMQYEIKPIVDVNGFNKWERLLGTLAAVKLFTLKTRKLKLPIGNATVGQEELQWAFDYLIKMAQNDVYNKEIDALKHNNYENISKKLAIKLQRSFGNIE